MYIISTVHVCFVHTNHYSIEELYVRISTAYPSGCVLSQGGFLKDNLLQKIWFKKQYGSKQTVNMIC